ncbi:NOL1/NOP2/sun family RNA methylase, putative (macronuclear) [Tetrahymena thermophila SB210]|uniref:NOL1/NOP2/sun family RNA methylase, putative n=1 Tax=Tetrahymena thermophila (strain SB210) TaxID=312017 RepID=Q22HF4_TETTS|nr:NOL1/NOP2/sun family RNA methylase, putative [Tetrahymena thermophila SB210]EAR84747.2 NOL1/NOP2/sun family RNA methylase, putative [Tetrahymena thermophila SB210]|eukprot:XP_001032410.2 NOL1/NOP2/sun family RNA methylase, putative [Tetrahymena thermophila SB210]
MGPTKKELKKQMELLRKQQEEQEQEDSDEIDQEEEDDFEEGDDLDGQDIEDEEEHDDGEDLEEGDDDEDDEDEELDEDGEEIPKLQPNSKLPRKLPNDKSDDEDEGDMEAKAKEQYMMGLKGQPDQAILNMKINDILHILSKFKENSKDGRSRQSYLEELTEYFMQYYNYNRDLVQLFMTMFNPNELVQFFESNEQQRPLTIRTNTLKTRRKELAQILIQRGVNLDSLAEWTKVGLKIYDSKVPIGATPEYLAGHYMLQSASSFLPVIALAPQPNEKILDMAAAPGGKTTYIAQLMKNTGVLFANDVKADRNKALIFNVQRMGINNCIVTNYDGRKLNKVIHNCDRVLLDAPCTGLGIIARDPSVKATKQLIDVQKHAHLQRELILSAIDCCKKGGYVVYSTCSVTVQENESVVDYALKNRFVKLVDMGIEVGEEGYTKYQDKRFDPQLKKTRRILPHVHNMDGFYVAKLKKLENGPRVTKQEVVNDHLDAMENEDVENVNINNKNKKSDHKLKVQKGQQGVIEVTANGEDYDWNEEKEQEKIEKTEETDQKENEEQSKQAKKDQKKPKGEKKAQNETQVKKQDNKQVKKESNDQANGEKKLSKKEKKLAQKAQEKKEKQNNQVKQQDEEENVEEEVEEKPAAAKEQKQDKKNGQKKQNQKSEQKNTEQVAKQPLNKQQEKKEQQKPQKNNNAQKTENEVEEEVEVEEKAEKKVKDFKGKNNNQNNKKFNKFNKHQKNRPFNKQQGKHQFQKNKKVKTE